MKKVLGAARNQCGGCREYFNSNTAFEMHRTGEHGVDRRCMTVEEMKGKGMDVNAAGFWISMHMTRRLTTEEAEDEGST